jgi:hypothetical protein
LIRSVVVPRLVARKEELDRIQAVLSELGFKLGDGWDDDRSRGLPLLAPLGALEFYHGQSPAPADVIIEVEDVQRALDVVTRHNVNVLCDISRTHWNSDLFVATVGGCRLAFFSWAENSETPLPRAA